MTLIYILLLDISGFPKHNNILINTIDCHYQIIECAKWLLPGGADCAR